MSWVSGIVYSPLCDTDSCLYNRYLDLHRDYLQDVARVQCGASRSFVVDCSGVRFDAGLGSRDTGYVGQIKEVGEHVGDVGDGDGSARCGDSFSVGGADVGCACGCCKCGKSKLDDEKVGIADAGVAGDSRAAGSIERLCGDVCAGGVQSGVGELADGRTAGLSKPLGCGPNYERNRKNREEKKKRKKFRQAVGRDWRVTRGSVNRVGVAAEGVGGGRVDSAGSEKKGFWNSCSVDVRQELIDSKARMHIADNRRRAEEAEQRVKRLCSPEQILRDAMRMVDFANEQAKKKNDAKIYGWAKTVAETYAETIAKSAPTSVESFEDYIKSNSSITSVSLEAFNEVVKIKDALQLKYDELEKKVAGAQEVATRPVEKTAGPSVNPRVKRDLPVSKPVLSQAHFLQVTAQKAKEKKEVVVDASFQLGFEKGFFR